MPTKIDDKIRKEGQKRIIELMAKYGLNRREMAAKLLNVPVEKIANWRHGSTFFRKSDELMFLHAVQRKMHEYSEQVKEDLERFQF